MSERKSDIERKKRYLKKYKKNQACIDDLKSRIEELDDRIKTVKSPTLSGMPRGGLPKTKEDLIADKDDLERRLKVREEKAPKLKRIITDEIDNLDDTRYINILELFLIECLTFEDIADRLGYHSRHVERLYSEALNELVDNDI